MPDRLFTEPRLARLYDTLCRGRPDFAFYLPLVLAAESVLDVGCGTGELLSQARTLGHAGRLCGLDPADAMLGEARRDTDVEWILGDLASVAWDRAFALVVMTGHAFQVFVDDDAIRASLRAMRSALTDDGRLVFETRNPLVREWEQWTSAQAGELTTDDGLVVSVRREVVSVAGDVVGFTQTFTSPAWDQAEVSRSTLRFLDAPTLGRFLADAGLAVEAQYGDWSRGPLTAASPEIITVARRA